ALTGCTTVIDNGKLEKAVKDDFKQAGVPLKSASCPSDVEAKKGKTLDCTVVYSSDGSSHKLTVHVNDSKGNVSYTKADLH
ncbi:MAG: hypothetical protein QOG68_951, partial [Solirubrobacteraceae bacterium]|nr:hypothetical protein [Solirubrobacteraceae bacterium]